MLAQATVVTEPETTKTSLHGSEFSKTWKTTKKGLPGKIQKALDSVRVIGNNAVHPGEIDLKDDAVAAIGIFSLVNMIVEVMITQPKKVDEIFKKIPEGAREAIEKRNKNK